MEQRDATSGILPWQVFVAELIGTAVLLFVGLSLVILMFGAGSPLEEILPSEAMRRFITGFLFGTTGALIAISPVGAHSGAHINPIVTLAFRLMGKLDLRATLGYVVAQLTGAILGALPLLAWGAMEVLPHASLAAFSRSASRSRSCTTSTATATGCFAG